MTRANELVKRWREEDNNGVDVEDIMSIHAQQFAEWCSNKGWKRWSTIWKHDNNEYKTTSELYTIFNNQNK
jgi:hypothetical protein